MSAPGTRPPLVTRLFTKFLGSAVSNAAGYAVGGAVLPTLEPYTQSLANETWALHPAKPIPVNAAAEAWLRGYLSLEQAESEAEQTGFDGDRFAVLRRLNGTPLPLETMLALRRRGVIDAEQLEAGIAQAGILPEWRDRAAAMLNVLPSVTDLVRFAVREVFDPAQREQLDLDAEFPPAFAELAERIGLSRQTAGQYWAAHWELPSFEQLATMLHRGEITSAQFSGALKAIDIAPTWRSKLEAIARRIPPLEDMIRFAVRDVYSPQTRASLGLDEGFPADFAREGALHGMSDEHLRQYWAAHWRLPSALQGYRMLWRGVITDAQLDELLRALDYPPVWRDRLAAIARLVPGRIDLKRMLAHDILSEAEVRAGYERLGYSTQDAQRMTQIAVAELAGSETASPWASRARSRLFTVAHNEYLAASIDEAKARELLGRVGASSAEQTAILALWDAEQEINRLELTATQIRAALRKGVIDEPTALAELAERGMTDEDARIFVAS